MNVFFCIYFLGTSSVARGYSGYVDQLLGNPMRTFFRENMKIQVDYLADYPDLFALGLVLALTGTVSCIHSFLKIYQSMEVD